MSKGKIGYDGLSNKKLIELLVERDASLDNLQGRVVTLEKDYKDFENLVKGSVKILNNIDRLFNTQAQAQAMFGDFRQDFYNLLAPLNERVNKPKVMEENKRRG